LFWSVEATICRSNTLIYPTRSVLLDSPDQRLSILLKDTTDIVCISTLVRFQPASFVFFWINADVMYVMQIYYKCNSTISHSHTHTQKLTIFQLKIIQK